MASPAMALPPGASLVGSQEIKLPPGAQLVGGQSAAHQAFLDAKAAHPNLPVEELNTTPSPEGEQFKAEHPTVYGVMKALFETAEPQPGIMAMEGPASALVQAAGKSAPGAGDFISKVLNHPKTVAAMKDAALEWLKELPGVRGTMATAKAASKVKDVIGDVRAAQALEDLPIHIQAAPPEVGAPVNGTPLRPPLAQPGVPAPFDNVVPIRPPLAEVSPTPPLVAEAPAPSGPVVPIRPPLAAAGAAPPKSAAPVSLDEKLTALLQKVRAESGADPDLHLGELKGGRYPARFGGADSPVIHSELRKAGSTAEVANPGLLLPKTEFIESLPDSSPLRHNPKALDAAYKFALELKKSGVNVTSIGQLMKSTGK